MTDDHIYFQWMVEQGLVRIGARAIIVNASHDRFLVERHTGAQEEYVNFIGGGVELGETLEACLKREIREETNARVTRLEYLFVVENFVTYQGNITHGLGHYFEVELDHEEVRSPTVGIEFLWLSSEKLTGIDLRPQVVRDHLANDTYRSVRHLISTNEIS